jgi:hypothetical protein
MPGGNMQIEIDNSTDGTIELNVTFSVPYDGNWTYTFSHQGSRIEAAFIRDAIETQFQEAIERIREKAYNEGYKDGRSKRKKKDWFKECFNYLANRI